jgi:DinB superfamily
MDTQKWTHELDRITNDFKNAFGQLSPSQLNQKPNAQTWSIAQNLEHLILINETYYPVIQQIRANTYSLPWHAKIGFIRRFFENFILKAVQPENRRKIKTQPIWEPTTGNIDGNIVATFVQHQFDLKKFIQNSSDLLDKGQVVYSPAARMIVYRLETAFDIIVAHERRHFEQAKEVYKLQNQ